MADDKTAPQAPADNRDTLDGFLFALAAYLMWGFLPFYMKALAHVPAAEVVAHRALWSVPIAGVVLVALRRTADLKAALRSWPMIRMAMLTAGLISINWGVYVWAVGNGRTVETALGYYINPLFSVLLAATLLKERLNRAQWVAIAFAVVAVAILTVESGGLPWVSLALCVSWGFYAFFRKTLPIGPNQGFLLEVLILSPFALGYLIWLSLTGQNHFAGGDWRDMALLAGAGVLIDYRTLFCRPRHRGAAHFLCQRRQAAAPVDHRHHAVHRAVDNLHHRRLRLPRTVRHDAPRRLRLHLGRAGHL